MGAGSVQWRGRVTAAVVVAMALAAGCEGSSRAPKPELPVDGSTVPPLPSGLPAQAGERRPATESLLVKASSCDGFAEGARRVTAAAVGPFGFTGRASTTRSSPPPGPSRQEASASGDSAGAAGAAPEAGTDFSSTNVQEAGVDEPDRVKTDGRLLVTTVDGRLRVVDVRDTPRLVGTLDLPEGGSELLLVGDRALVLAEGGGRRDPRGSRPDGAGDDTIRPHTTVTVVDLKDPAKPSVVRTHKIDGSYLDARLVDGVARIVTRSQPNITFGRPTTSADYGSFNQAKATEANAAVVRLADAAAFLPEGASCTDAYLPADSAGAGTVAVQSLDPAAEQPGPAVTVVTDASTVYASAGRLFVATTRLAGGPVPLANPEGDGAPRVAPTVHTAIHAFDISDPAKARYAGSGDVPGHLLNQFSLSEHAGVLRVATTLSETGGSARDADGAAARTQSQSRVTVLRPAGEEWVETGAVDGLGRGEQIYAVRFLGATGYVVTFRQVDPLYVVDLRDPKAPKVTGELKITGYSAYLHPAGDGRLLGLGQEATEQGRRQGTQLSLFDVANPAAPAKLAGAVLPTSSSTAEQDHHAFLFWPASGLVLAPMRSYGTSPGSVEDGAKPVTRPFVGAVAFKVGDRSVNEAARITHPGSTPIDRSVVVGDRLLTLSPVGIATNDLATLADVGFLTFR